MATIYAGTNGYLDTIPTEQVRAFVIGLRQYLSTNEYTELVSSTGNFDEKIENLLKDALSTYLSEFS